MQHPTGGIDWDVYTIGNESQQAVIGNWGHSWNPIGEQAQFVAANGGRTYSERQHVLRVHGNNSFWTIILPYNKGQRPANLSVTQDPTTKDAVITRASQTIRANEHYYTYTDGTKKILTSFDNASVSGNGMTISGGAMEIAVSGTTATLTFSGAAGTRSFTLPGTGWIAANGVQGSGSSFTYNYAGQNQFKNNSYTITLSRKALAEDRG